MDTGDSYYFSDTKLIKKLDSYYPDEEEFTSSGSNSVTADGITYTLETANVMKTASSRFFREGGATRSFRVKVSGFSDTLSSRSMTVPGQNIPVRRRNTDNSSDQEEITTLSDGTAEFNDAVAGDAQTITTETDTGSTEVNVQPNYDGQFVGTIPVVESGYNFKTSYSVDESQLVHGYLYGNGYNTYDLTINFKNIGDADAKTSVWEVTLPQGLNTNSSTTGNFSTIAQGSLREINLTVSAGDISGDYEDKEIMVEITDSETERTWVDYVVLRFFNRPVQFRVRAYNIDGGGSLKSFLITPEKRSIFFEVNHDSTKTITLPYRSESYGLAFSGAGHTDEMKYSFAVGESPNSVGGETWSIEQINRFREYDTEDNAFSVSDPTTPTDGYLGVDEINYFDIDLTGFSDLEYKAITVNTYADDDVGGNSDGIPNPSEDMTMDVRIQNSSLSKKEAVQAVLSTTNSNITITNGSFTYGDIIAGYYHTIAYKDDGDDDGNADTVTNHADYYIPSMDPSTSSAFTYSIASDCPAGEVVTFTLTMTDTWGNTWTDTFDVTIQAPGASMAVHAYKNDDVAGNDNEIPNPAEEVQMDVRVHNEGTSRALAIQSELSTTNSNITITNGSFTYGDIIAGYYHTIAYKDDGDDDGNADTVTNHADYYIPSMDPSTSSAFTYSIASDCPAGEVVTFTLTMTDTWGNTWTDTFDVTVQ